MKRLSVLRIITFAFVAIVFHAIVFHGQPTHAQSARSEPLFAGCNNVALTYPAGTPISVVAQGISGSIVSIFRYDNAQMRFVGWAPGVPDFAIDYAAVVRQLEPVFICMHTAGELMEPELGTALSAPPTATAVATATPPGTTVADQRPRPVIETTIENSRDYILEYQFRLWDGEQQLPVRDEVEVCRVDGGRVVAGLSLSSQPTPDRLMLVTIDPPTTPPCLRLYLVDARFLSLYTPDGAASVRVSFVNCRTCNAFIEHVRNYRRR